MEFDDQIALVTGASRGIGQAIAMTLAESGAYVVGTATSEEGVRSVKKNFAERNLSGDAYVLDIKTQSSLIAFENTMKDHAHVPSILVNNAGVTRDNLFIKMKNDEWNDVINVNLSSMYKITKMFLKDMLKARYGRIINITSVVAVSGNAGQTNYAASKAGIIGFTRSLAKEVGIRGITVNAVAPGFIKTDMTQAIGEKQEKIFLEQIPLRRLGQPGEIAETVAFLASGRAAYITGETINVNGGM